MVLSRSPGTGCFRCVRGLSAAGGRQEPPAHRGDGCAGWQFARCRGVNGAPGPRLQATRRPPWGGPGLWSPRPHLKVETVVRGASRSLRVSSGSRPPLLPSQGPEPLWSVLCLPRPACCSQGPCAPAPHPSEMERNQPEQSRKSPPGPTFPTSSAELSFPGAALQGGHRDPDPPLPHVAGCTVGTPHASGFGAMAFLLSTPHCPAFDGDLGEPRGGASHSFWPLPLSAAAPMLIVIATPGPPQQLGLGSP